MEATSELPLITRDLPGIGGALRSEVGDFAVDEIPAYAPEGLGDHVFASIEKRGITTRDAVRALAHALGVKARDVGTAGLKDRWAVTRQQISFPPPATPDAVRDLELPGVRVLSAERHPHKLKTGHLSGNRFALRVRRLAVPGAEGADRARAILQALAVPPGCPNWYGEQRFGAAGDNAARGRELVTGARSPASLPPRQRRLLVSAYQSMLFNAWLRRRIDDGLYRRALEGDLLQPLGSRGTFVCTEAGREQARLDAGEIVATGPMFGHRVRLAEPDSPAGLRERSVLDHEGVDVAAFAKVGKLAPGTRRASAVPLRSWDVTADTDAVEVRFTLPPGAYATAVLREIMKDERSANAQP